MTTAGVNVKVTGRLFTDAEADIRLLANNIIREVVQLGESRLDQTLRPRPAGVYLSVAQAGRNQASTGRYRRSVHARFRDLHARIDDGGVVYGPWLEHGAGGTRFRGYAAFRRTGQFMQKQVGRVSAKHINRYIRRLG